VSKVWWNLVKILEIWLNSHLKPKTFLSFPIFHVFKKKEFPKKKLKCIFHHHNLVVDCCVVIEIGLVASGLWWILGMCRNYVMMDLSKYKAYQTLVSIFSLHPTEICVTLLNIIRLPTEHCLNFNRIQAITLSKVGKGNFFRSCRTWL